MQQLRDAWLQTKPLSFHTLTKNEIDEVSMPALDARITPLSKWLLAIGKAYQEIAPVKCRELQDRVKMLYLNTGEYLLAPFDHKSEEIFRIGVFFGAYWVHFSDDCDKSIADPFVCSIEKLENSLTEGEMDARIKDHLLLIAKLYDEFIDFINRS
jgi:hypothetical protein